MRPTPDCQALRDDLKAYADGELPLVRRVGVRAHVLRCADCQQELMEMERITEEMKKQGSMVGATLAPDLRARLLSRLEGVKPGIGSNAAVMEAAANDGFRRGRRRGRCLGGCLRHAVRPGTAVRAGQCVPRSRLGTPGEHASIR